MPTYTIKSGDTLSRIASQYGTTVSALMAANPQIKDANKIYAGASLTIPAITPAKTTAPVQTPQTSQQTQTDAISKQLEEIKKQAEAIQQQQATTNNQPAPAPTPTPTSTNNVDVSWLTSLPGFSTLPADMQNYLKQYYTILKTNDTDAQKTLQDALTQAKAQAEPYFKEIISQAQDQLTRDIAGKEADFATQERNLQESISRIKNDLATKKGDLTIDEQAELTRQARKYENDLQTLRENAVASGLTFSTKRNKAEEQLNTSNTDIVESTRLNYMRQARDLETAASRGEQDALNKIAEYKRILGESEMSAIRGIESKLGSANLPTLNTTTGATGLGNISGSLAEDKIKDIWTRAEALATLGNPF